MYMSIPLCLALAFLRGWKAGMPLWKSGGGKQACAGIAQGRIPSGRFLFSAGCEGVSARSRGSGDVSTSISSIRANQALKRATTGCPEVPWSESPLCLALAFLRGWKAGVPLWKSGGGMQACAGIAQGRIPSDRFCLFSAGCGARDLFFFFFLSLHIYIYIYIYMLLLL